MSTFRDSYFDPYAVELQDFTAQSSYAFSANLPELPAPHCLEYRPPSQETLRRCPRCELYYTFDSNTRCSFHPGFFTSVLSGSFLASISSQKWSCCRNRDQKAPGCVTQKNHFIVDEVLPVFVPIDSSKKKATNLPSLPPPKPPVEPIGHLEDYRIRVESTFPRSHSARIGTGTESFCNNRDNLNGTPVFKHFVSNRDTLHSIALKYRVTVAQIQSLNKLSGSIYGRYFLWVPDTGGVDLPEEDPEQLKKRVISRFRRRCSCTLPEAEYYLEDSHWNYDQAVEAWTADLAWEASLNRVQSKN